MAAMDQGKLNSMCNSINNGASNYVTTLTTQSKNMVDVFNASWISNSSRKLADAIKNSLTELANDISKVFSGVNEAIATNVRNFNSVENEDINYPGFSFEKPDLNFELSATLPNGKLGVAEGADLKDIQKPYDSLVSQVVDVLNEIKDKVKSADAFSVDEQEALTTGVEKCKNRFENSMNDLKEQISKTMSDEISLREELNKVNIANVSDNIQV